MRRPAQPKILFQLNLHPDLYAELQREATEARTSMSEVARRRLKTQTPPMKDLKEAA